MSKLVVKGVQIGCGMPKTIVPIMDTTQSGLLTSAQRAVEAGADCIEWRADFAAVSNGVEDLRRMAEALASALPATPLIATLRTQSQGGQLDVDGRQYEDLVRAVALYPGPSLARPDFVDIEANKGADRVRLLASEAQGLHVHTIVSQHDFKRTPSVGAMTNTLCDMRTYGASICKLAVMACEPGDAARLMEATARAAGGLDVPLITMSMGAAGSITRLVGESFGSCMTFCSLDAASAPGQVSLAKARVALGALHDALAPTAVVPTERSSCPKGTVPRGQLGGSSGTDGAKERS